MIQRLGQLTMSQYIELMCGDVSVLKATEVEKPLVMAVRRKIIFEFAEIANPSITRSTLSENKGKMSNKAQLMLFSVLMALCSINAYDDVRTLMKEYGLSADKYDNERLVKEVEIRLKRAKSEVGRDAANNDEEEKKESRSADEIRRSYDSQAASLMAYFKFQIDMDTMKATTFAHLLAQADREVAARKAVMKR